MNRTSPKSHFSCEKNGDAVMAGCVKKTREDTDNPTMVRMVIVLLVAMMLTILSAFVLLYQRVST